MFEVTGNHISELTDEDLRMLVAKLALAELGRLGLPQSGVEAGGNQNASDSGIDVWVSRPTGAAVGDFIPRDETGIQVKLPDMSRSEIIKEMCPNGLLRPVIGELADRGGAYLIVSAKGSASKKSLTSRRNAMREALAGHPNGAALYTDFYDRERIANWVQQYPGIAVWVLERIGRAVKGWQSWASWSEGGAKGQLYLVDDAPLLLDEHSGKAEPLPIVEGITKIRALLNQPRKCVRLLGLSGVGKTRLVEALFESEVGDAPLPSSLAVYTDNADEPNPSARDMARYLIASGQRAILIVDNCNPATHATLAQICSVSGSTVSLITVEYDVRDDEPESTEVFRLAAASLEVVERWLERSCPHVSQIDRHRIASFSDGNFRVARALAHTIKKGETLGTLNDRALFERIFDQRNLSDKGLMAAAEICSLVYSFDGEDTTPSGELAALARLAGLTVEQLYGHIAELKLRGVIQTRSRWRAILPHAIANRLAGLALERITTERLFQFSTSLSPRLLRSLSRRLGYLHGSQGAQSLVAAWLAPQGPLGNLSKLTEDGLEILRNIAPVAPDAVLAMMDQAISGASGASILATENWSRRHWIGLLKALAYDPSAFDRTIRLLGKFVAAEPKDYNSNSAAVPFRELFHLRLSGTKATPDQRRTIVREFLLSDEPTVRECGFAALDALLATYFSSLMSGIDFGARPRDFGWLPTTSADFVAWYVDGIKLIADLLSHGDIAPRLRSCLAQAFRSLWSIAPCRGSLEDVATTISAQVQWTEGWIAVRATIRYDGKELEAGELARLKALEQMLEPKNFLDTVRAYIFSQPWGLFDIAEGDEDDVPPGEAYKRVMRRTEAFGAEIATMPEMLPLLLDEAVIAQQGRLVPFGHGLAMGALDIDDMWSQIMAALERHPLERRQIHIVGGFFSGLAKREAPELEALLDYAVTDPTLAPHFPWLQAIAGLSAAGIERLHRSLDAGIAEAWSFSNLSIGGVIQSVPGLPLAELLRRIATIPNGYEIAVDILNMRYFGDRQDGIEVEPTLIEFGRWLLSNLEISNSQRSDHNLGEIVSICLSGEAAEPSARRILQRIKKKVDERLPYHLPYAFMSSHLIEKIFRNQPIAALDEFLAGDAESGWLGEDNDLGLSRRPPLEVVELDTLQQWSMVDPEVRIPRLANSIGLFAKQSDGASGWSPTFLRLLELAPDKGKFLSNVRRRLRPNGWSGSLAAILDERRSLMDELTLYGDPTITEWASEQARRLELEAKSARMRERRQDESFE